jgi:hypothetical protein
MEPAGGKRDTAKITILAMLAMSWTGHVTCLKIDRALDICSAELHGIFDIPAFAFALLLIALSLSLSILGPKMLFWSYDNNKYHTHVIMRQFSLFLHRLTDTSSCSHSPITSLLMFHAQSFHTLTEG